MASIPKTPSYKENHTLEERKIKFYQMPLTESNSQIELNIPDKYLNPPEFKESITIQPIEKINECCFACLT